MYKVTLLLALGFAAASAFLQDFQRDLQGTITPTNFTTTCNRVATETCTGGYCCAAVTRNGTAVNTNATLGTCVPAEFHTQAFNVSGSISATCPAEETGGDGSFAAAIKVTAVMVLALVAGMFF
ncbi:hypothetical protein FGO68_gene13963 [Halteria grandinella]|uniref:Uncharacterized protein n=1 Tax=Halteria grandinella TaxID=5974 RepID=A0A8J8NLT7_HALGN|nr:hypothetical protein FGO68_gene13963 [Halteria grandinella]